MTCFFVLHLLVCVAYAQNDEPEPEYDMIQIEPEPEPTSIETESANTSTTSNITMTSQAFGFNLNSSIASVWNGTTSSSLSASTANTTTTSNTSTHSSTETVTNNSKTSNITMTSQVFGFSLNNSIASVWNRTTSSRFAVSTANTTTTSNTTIASVSSGTSTTTEASTNTSTTSNITMTSQGFGLNLNSSIASVWNGTTSSRLSASTANITTTLNTTTHSSKETAANTSKTSNITMTSQALGLAGISTNTTYNLTFECRDCIGLQSLVDAALLVVKECSSDCSPLQNAVSKVFDALNSCSQNCALLSLNQAMATSNTTTTSNTTSSSSSSSFSLAITLSGDHAAGETTLRLSDVSGLSAGMLLTISGGGNSETKTIVAINPDSSRRLVSRRLLAAGTITIDSPLQNAYSHGASIVAISQAYGCIMAGGTGCATCVTQASRTSAHDCDTCNPGYELSGTQCQAYGCIMAAGGCATCVTQASRTSSYNCATCNPGYRLIGTRCQAASCPAGYIFDHFGYWSNRRDQTNEDPASCAQSCNMDTSCVAISVGVTGAIIGTCYLFSNPVGHPTAFSSALACRKVLQMPVWFLDRDFCYIEYCNNYNYLQRLLCCPLGSRTTLFDGGDYCSVATTCSINDIAHITGCRNHAHYYGLLQNRITQDMFAPICGGTKEASADTRTPSLAPLNGAYVGRSMSASAMLLFCITISL